MHWEHNIWTGIDLLDVTGNGRIARQKYIRSPPLYRAEFWGDFSLSFPQHGPWRNSLQTAKKDLAQLTAKHLVHPVEAP